MTLSIDLKPYATLPDTAHLKIVSVAGNITESNRDALLAITSELMKHWTESGKIQDGASAYQANGAFLIVAYQPGGADVSGCTKDQLMHVLLDFERRSSVPLLNAPRFAVELDGIVKFCSQKEFRELRESSVITDDSIVYDHMIQTLGELRNGKFQKLIPDSWYAPVGATS